MEDCCAIAVVWCLLSWRRCWSIRSSLLLIRWLTRASLWLTMIQVRRSWSFGLPRNGQQTPAPEGTGSNAGNGFLHVKVTSRRNGRLIQWIHRPPLPWIRWMCNCSADSVDRVLLDKNCCYFATLPVSFCFSPTSSSSSFLPFSASSSSFHLRCVC